MTRDVLYEPSRDHRPAQIPAIGFGPGDENQAHAPNEINRVDDLEICAAFYAMLPYSLEARGK